MSDQRANTLLSKRKLTSCAQLMTRRLSIGRRESKWSVYLDPDVCNSPATSEKRLPVHFHARLATELPPTKVRVVWRVNVVVRQRLVHVHVKVQSIKKDGCIFVTHQVANQAILWNSVGYFELLIRLVCVDDFSSTFLVVQRVQNFIEPRVTLLLIQEEDELVYLNVVRLPFGSVMRCEE